MVSIRRNWRHVDGWWRWCHDHHWWWRRSHDHPDGRRRHRRPVHRRRRRRQWWTTVVSRRRRRRRWPVRRRRRWHAGWWKTNRRWSPGSRGAGHAQDLISTVFVCLRREYVEDDLFVVPVWDFGGERLQSFDHVVRRSFSKLLQDQRHLSACQRCHFRAEHVGGESFIVLVFTETSNDGNAFVARNSAFALDFIQFCIVAAFVLILIHSLQSMQMFPHDFLIKAGYFLLQGYFLFDIMLSKFLHKSILPTLRIFSS